MLAKLRRVVNHWATVYVVFTALTVYGYAVDGWKDAVPPIAFMGLWAIVDLRRRDRD